MENISDAIKIAGAALIFILLLSITVRLYGQARETSDVILFSADKTNYYQLMEPNENDVTRIVGIETIIPTLYTYCQTDGPAIRIIYPKNGNNYEMVFDTEMESIIRSAPLSLSDSEKQVYDSYHDKYYGAPWVSGDTDKSGYLNHINDFLYGNYHVYSNKNVYANTDCENNGVNFLLDFKNSSFEESYVEYNTSGFYKEDGFGNWYTIVDGNQKTVITYRYLKEK